LEKGIPFKKWEKTVFPRKRTPFQLEGATHVTTPTPCHSPVLKNKNEDKKKERHVLSSSSSLTKIGKDFGSQDIRPNSKKQLGKNHQDLHSGGKDKKQVSQLEIENKLGVVD